MFRVCNLLDFHLQPGSLRYPVHRPNLSSMQYHLLRYRTKGNSWGAWGRSSARLLREVGLRSALSSPGLQLLHTNYISPTPRHHAQVGSNECTSHMRAATRQRLTENGLHATAVQRECAHHAVSCLGARVHRTWHVACGTHSGPSGSRHGRRHATRLSRQFLRPFGARSSAHRLRNHLTEPVGIECERNRQRDCRSAADPERHRAV